MTSWERWIPTDRAQIQEPNVFIAEDVASSIRNKVRIERLCRLGSRVSPVIVPVWSEDIAETPWTLDRMVQGRGR